jgi:hypothetical protein
MSHRRSPARTFALVLLVVVLIRLALTLVDLIARALVWLLLRACWALEWAVRKLTLESASGPATSVLPPVPQARMAAGSGRAPVPPAQVGMSSAISIARGQRPVPPVDEISKFMRVLGTKDRAEAERIYALRTKVRV